MAEKSKTFSESWYRVADQRLCLRPQVSVSRQYFRGERWYLLQDPFNNRFFRVRPEAYELLVRLSPRKTVETAWKECLEVFPDTAPGQEDVIQLLAQLYHSNLLQFESAADTAKLFKRYKERRQREKEFQLMNIMFARFPLWDPNDFLNRTVTFAKLLFGRTAAVVWLVVVIAALKVLIENWGQLHGQTQSVLSPGNLPLLYAGLVIIKGLHEFGHAFACRRFGGEVHTMGIMLLIFTPIPYIDVTSSWGFKSRWHRLVVDAAGMIVEIFVAAIAVFVWANTGPGTLHALSYNMMFIASVSTVLFNGNPLLRYDGYYILSDLVDTPNLHERTTRHMRHLAEHYLYGVKHSHSPASSLKEAIWLTLFGIASNIYRVIVFSGIIMFVGNRFLVVGVIMAIVCGTSWICVPIIRLVNYLASSPRLGRTRLRACLSTAGVLTVIVLLLTVIPCPHSFHAPGILRTEEYTDIVALTPGYVTEVHPANQTQLPGGETLVSSRNEELAIERRVLKAMQQETSAMRVQARASETADLGPLAEYARALENQQTHLNRRLQSLMVTAPHEGLWRAPGEDLLVGAWMARGTPLGILVNPGAFRFSAIVPQEEAGRLFGSEIRNARVRLHGQATRPLEVSHHRVIPAEQQQLPSAALGWQMGGDVAVSLSDPSGTRVAEPFFEIAASVVPRDDTVLLHGQTGRIRFSLPPEPLAKQGWRKLRQLLQKRYQL